ncbi:hypothetical protein Q8A67_007783 [Cirrhinus molitorella]|uniref:C2H2-type domain-containing protein n=1 Tax=Cirrhinus molitorella TaxID=172907 RepID=A0AA88TS63_9TELE|nr:hypothetical protein Q8A67_007783 [Cirrhinus molitorella]
MQVKPVEIGIKETTRHNDMRKTTLGFHSYCASEQAATNDTCNASQNCIDSDTDSTNQALHIKTETESLPIIDRQNDTFSFSSCPLSQEQEHLSFRLKEENDNEHGLRESTCEVAAEEEVGLTEDDESTDAEDEGNPDSLPHGDTPYIPEEDFCTDLKDSDSKSSSYGHHQNKNRQTKQTPDRNRPANMNLESVEEGSVCCVCGDTIPFLNKLIEHFKTHTAEVYCHLCRTKFESVMSLALHLKNAHPQKCFMCKKCGALFRCTWHLNGHIEKHRKDAMQVKPVEIGIKETTRHNEMRKTALGFHSYCASEQAAMNDACNYSQNCIDSDTNSTNQALHIKTETESLPIIDRQNDTFSFSSCPLRQEQEHLSFRLKEENDNEHRLRGGAEVAAEEEVGLTEDDESIDTEDEESPDSLPPGDTPYIPEEDLCSDLEDSDSRSSSYGHHRNKKRQKKQTPDRNKPANTNLESADITKKFGFQSDSPFCCYGKFANLGKHMEDCRNKLRLACCLCNMACENEELLLKHLTVKHPTAGYICAYCYKVFPLQDSFKNHVCLRRPTGGINLPATPVTQLPVVPLSDSSRQVKPSAPDFFTNQNTIKIIKITQTVNKSSTAPIPPSAGSAKALTVHQLLQATPLVPAKRSYWKQPATGPSCPGSGTVTNSRHVCEPKKGFSSAEATRAELALQDHLTLPSLRRHLKTTVAEGPSSLFTPRVKVVQMSVRKVVPKAAAFAETPGSACGVSPICLCTVWKYIRRGA